MNATDIQAVILAAGTSSRFISTKTKLLEKVCGQEMILYPLHLLSKYQIPTAVVIGHDKKHIKESIAKHITTPVAFVEQESQRGTGHAVLCSQSIWYTDHILIINGDMPLISTNIIEQLIEEYRKNQSVISLVIAHNTDTQSGQYGRIVQTDIDVEIIEAQHFTQNVSDHPYINAGIYLINRTFLEESIEKITRNDQTHEFYITDLVKIASEQQHNISLVKADFQHVRGVNTLKELYDVQKIKQSEIIEQHMTNGVQFVNPEHVSIDITARIEPTTRIAVGVQITGCSLIKARSSIGPFSIINDSLIGQDVTIKSHTVIDNTTIENNCTVGPLAHLHDQTVLQAHGTIGNFVEMKNSIAGQNTKAKHLAYIGDTTIGNKTNIGAGTITCNYNGQKKNQTLIGNNVFIGSNTTLIAPLTIEDNAVVAGGSVITDTVPQYALALGRARQITKAAYAHKYQNKKKSDQITTDITPSKHNVTVSEY